MESDQPSSSTGSNPASDIRLPSTTTLSTKGFWLGTTALVLLAVIGVGGQFIGLKSIDAYSRIRGQLLGAQNEHARLGMEISVLDKDLAALRAETVKAKEESNRISLRLTEAKRAEELSLDGARKAQEEFAKVQAEQLSASKERDVAIKQRDTARKSAGQLEGKIKTLTSEQETLEQAVGSLRGTREELDGTLTQLRKETDSLHEVSQLVTSKRNEVRDLESQLQELQSKLDALQARQDSQDQVSVEISTLEQRRNDLERGVQDLKKKEATARERVVSLTRELESARNALAAASAKVTNLDQAEETLNQSVQSLTAMVASAEAELRAKKAELEVRTNEVTRLDAELGSKRDDLASLVGRVAQSGEYLKQLETSRAEGEKATTEAAAARATQKEMKDTIAKLESQTEIRRRELRELNIRLDDLRSEESRHFGTLKDLLGSLEGVLSAINAGSGTPVTTQPVDRNDRP
ncbi:MAG: hypothetical protein HS101_18445 [Planctomycetia bacterium]|nr:hypothetical protein [Planctomycetia bacterium]